MADVKWIKITTDIFDDEKILLIESLPDADAVIVIWFKLLCLAGKQNNSGVFIINDKMAYTEEMLATIFRRPLNTVRLALDAFETYGMIERMNGVITIPKWEKHQNIDALEKMRRQTRERVARHREKQARLECNVTDNVTVTLSNAIEKKREDKIREDKKRKEKYYPYDEKLDQAFADYVAMRKQIKAPMTDRAIDLAMKKLEALSGGDNDKAIEVLNQSVMNSWKGLFEVKGQAKPQAGKIDWDSV